MATRAGREEGLQSALSHFGVRQAAGGIVFNQAALDRLLKSEEGPVGKMVLQRSIQVERGAKRLAPVDTGRLRASITHTLERDDRGLVGYVGSNVTYAPYVEFGTRFQHAQPYLRPALRLSASRVAQRLTE